MNNMDLWNSVEKSDPAYVRSFRRPGGFSGSAIDPQYNIRRATERWGPIGARWWTEVVGDPLVVPVGDEVVVYLRVRLYHPEGEGERPPFVEQFGGDKIAVSQKGSVRANDEALKSAYTDAVSKCLSLLGFGADVHLGEFDNKYAQSHPQRRDDPAIDKTPLTLEDFDAKMCAVSQARGFESAAMTWWKSRYCQKNNVSTVAELSDEARGEFISMLASGKLDRIKTAADVAENGGNS